MKLRFSSIGVKEYGQVFELFKLYLKPIIEDAIGWDEDFQKNGFTNRLPLESFSWIKVDGNRVGLVCFKTLEDKIHIHLLIIFEAYQKQGFAVLVTEYFKSLALNNHKHLTLSCFKNNVPAIKLYKKLNFLIESEDKHFFDFSISNFT